MQTWEPNLEFNPNRLRLARNLNGWSQSDLADRISVSQVFVGYLESGQKHPTGLTVETIAEVCGFEPSFFCEGVLDEFKDEDCYFRRRKATPVTIRSRILAKGALINQLVSYLDAEVSLPATKIPKIRVDERADIERAAERCRMEWGLGQDVPIKSMMRVLENAGIIAFTLSEEDEKIDAFSHLGKRSVVVLNTVKQSASRSRFDMAHECGHLVMHEGKNSDSLEIEVEADYFASAFLLPRTGFVREFPRTPAIDWTAMFRLKKRWRVSLAAMFRRAYDLSLISAVQYQRAYKQLAAKGWLKGEPEEFEAEQPEVINAAIRILEKDGTSPTELCKTLKWKPSTFQGITGFNIKVSDPVSSKGMVVSLKSHRGIDI